MKAMGSSKDKAAAKAGAATRAGTKTATKAAPKAKAKTRPEPAVSPGDTLAFPVASPRPEKRHGIAGRLVAAAAMLLTCPVLMLVFERNADALFPQYRSFSKALLGALALAMSVVPFALWDIAALALVAATLVRVVLRFARKRPLAPWLATLTVMLSVICLLTVGGWALNHYAPPLSEDLGLEVNGGTLDELYETCAYHLEQAATLAREVPRDESYDLLHQDFYELARIAGASYEGLAARYPVFQGSSAPVKSLLVWGEPLLYSGHTGIFFAATAEAGVPLNCADADLPFVMCHEAAHRLGLAGEEEANFAAYVACASSDDARFAYAGHYKAFVYCYNKLRAKAPERAQELFDALTQAGLGDGISLVRRDMAATSTRYAAYEGPFEKIGTTVNDTYLKSFGEVDGVQSYGYVVNYLIAWHKAGRDS